MAGVVVLGEADAGGSGGCCPLWATYRNTTIMDRKLIDLRLGPSISLMITSVIISEGPEAGQAAERVASWGLD